jgi:hypothetical protein
MKSSNVAGLQPNVSTLDPVSTTQGPAEGPRPMASQPSGLAGLGRAPGASEASGARPRVALEQTPGYVRTLQVTHPNSVADELSLHGKGVPVSATAVGTAPFRAFQQNNRSGLVLSQATPMVLGAKKDMRTNVLIKDEAFGQAIQQSTTRPDPALANAAKTTLQQHYAGDDDIRPPRLIDNQQELQAKYQEMALRQNGTVPDQSAKHAIADALKSGDPDFARHAATMPAPELRAHLQRTMSPEQFSAIEHALPKLEAMSPPQRQAYLEKGASETGQPKYSSKTLLPHNENLVQPRPQDVLGVLVGPQTTVAAQALQQQYADASGQHLPFMTYDNKTGQVQQVSPEEVQRMAAGH